MSILASPLNLDEIKQKENPEYWRNVGLQEIRKAINPPRNEKIAKNIILFIGDGMGVPTITAARYLKNNLKNVSQLYFETFPYSALSKVKL